MRSLTPPHGHRHWAVVALLLLACAVGSSMAIAAGIDARSIQETPDVSDTRSSVERLDVAERTVRELLPGLGEMLAVTPYFDGESQWSALSFEFREGSGGQLLHVICDLADAEQPIAHLAGSAAPERDAALLGRAATAARVVNAAVQMTPAWFGWFGGGEVWAVFEAQAGSSAGAVACNLTTLHCMKLRDLQRATTRSHQADKRLTQTPAGSTTANSELPLLVVDAPPLRGTIERRDSEDWYRVHIERVAEYEIEVVEGDLDQEALVIYRAADLVELARSADSWNSSIYVTLEPGEYLVRCSQHPDAGAGADLGDYTIQLHDTSGDWNPFPPSYLSIILNNGDRTTFNHTAWISFYTVVDMQSIMISESPDFDGAQWQPTNGARRIFFELSAGYGRKQIYVKLRNAKELQFGPRALSIEVIDGAPDPLVIDGPATWGTITQDHTDHWYQFEVSTEGDYRIEGIPLKLEELWLDLRGPAVFWVVPTLLITHGQDGSIALQQHLKPGTYFVKARRGRNLDTGQYSVRVTSQIVRPVVSSFVLDHGSTITDSSRLEYSYAPAWLKHMISERRDFAGAEWKSSSSWQSFGLNPFSGFKTVYLKVRDSIGIESEPVSTTIYLDRDVVLDSPVRQTRSARYEHFFSFTAPEQFTYEIHWWLDTANLTSVRVFGPDDPAALLVSLGSGQPRHGMTRRRLAPGQYLVQLNTDRFTDRVWYGVWRQGPPDPNGFKINDGNASTSFPDVALDGLSRHYEYLPSESPDFAGATWRRSVYGPDVEGAVADAEKDGLGGGYRLSLTPGIKTVFLKLRTVDGVESTVTSDSIELLPAPPVSLTQVRINNGNTTTSRESVSISLTISGSPTDSMASESPNFAGAQWQPYPRSNTFVLSPGNGLKTIYCKVRNWAGVESAVAQGQIERVSPVTPVITSFYIVHAPVASTRDTYLSFRSGGEATHFQASESPHFADATWQPLSGSTAFMLSAEPGIKKIYLKVRNQVGMESAVASAQVELRYPPVSTVQINGGAAWTYSPQVRLNIVPEFPASHYRIMEDYRPSRAWLPFVDVVDYTLIGEYGLRKIIIAIHDAAEQHYSDASDVIEFRDPASLSLELRNLQGGTLATSERTIALAINFQEGWQAIMASESPSYAGARWMPYNGAALPTMTLSPGNGLKRVYLKLKEISGSEVQVHSDQIMLLENEVGLKLDAPATPGGLNFAGAVGWFTLTVPAYGSYSLQAECGTVPGMVLELRGASNRNSLIASQTVASGAAAISRMLTPGTYYARVTATSATDTGTYSISLARTIASKN